jgi:hypothetical protein
MRRLRDKTSIERPVDQTQHGLERFLASLRGRDGICRLRLRVPMDASPYGLSLDREVHIEATRARDEQTLDGGDSDHMDSRGEHRFTTIRKGR